MGNLLKLPVELRTMIAQEMNCRSDLYSMCLANKDLNAVATPVLYHSMELTLKYLEHNVSKVFDPANEGIKHIRNLQIEPDGCVPWQPKYAPVFVKLLTTIPKDRLHRFIIPNAPEVVHEVNLLLQLRQRQLKHYQLSDYDPEYESIADILPTKDQLVNITSVSLYVICSESAERASRILRACSPNLTRLYCELDGAFTNFHFLKEIFVADGSWLDGIESKRNLRHVGFGHVVWEYALEILGQMLAWNAVESLAFYQCLDSAYVLGYLSTIGIKLASLTLVNDGMSASDEDSLDKLLLSFSALKHLRVSIRPDEKDLECNGIAIMMHADSLRTIYLNDPDGVCDIGQDNKAFRDLCLDCGELEQLAFTMDYPYGGGSTTSMFADMLKSIQNLTRLRILRLFTERGPLGNGKTLLRRAQKLANTMFSTLHGYCPSLKAVVIDVRATDRGVDDHCAAIYQDTFCYLREIRTDIFGKTSAAGCAVTMKVLKRYISPCEILYDEHEPRVRELM